MDPSLEELFGSIQSASEVKNVAGVHSLQDSILVRTWVPHGEDFVGEQIFHAVIPSKFSNHVLRPAHDGSGHLSVRKTYDRISQHFLKKGYPSAH